MSSIFRESPASRPHHPHRRHLEREWRVCLQWMLVGLFAGDGQVASMRLPSIRRGYDDRRPGREWHVRLPDSIRMAAQAVGYMRVKLTCSCPLWRGHYRGKNASAQ